MANPTNPPPPPAEAQNDGTWEPKLTADGSYTFFSTEFGETFHSEAGARQEAFQKFAQATDLVAKAQTGQVRLLDVCYGLGYNTAAALEVIWAANPACAIAVVGLELDATVPIAATTPPLLASWSAPIQDILVAIAHSHRCTRDRLTAELHLGDARQTIQTLAQSGFQADAIFFDPFSPRRCPQLWTVDFLTWVARCLAPTGKLATYSRSASVRAALREAGLAIGTIPFPPHAPQLPSHEWAQGTVAGFEAAALPLLSQMEQEHLQTRAAIPYRDPTLCATAAEIHRQHQQAQAQAQVESTSSWRRRWGIR